MNRKKLASIVLAGMMCLTASLPAFADSGSSALPQDSPMAKYIYSNFAPKTQTSYKMFGSRHETSVSEIRESGNKLVVLGSDLSVGGGVIAIASKKYTLPGKIVLVSGAAVYAWGRVIQISVEDIENNAVRINEVYFKWTDAEQFEYSIKVNSWYECNGEKISGVTTTYNNGDLY